MMFNGGAEQNRPRKIDADAWFGFRNCDRFGIEEQSLMLPGDEVLTVLTIPENGSAEVDAGKQIAPKDRQTYSHSGADLQAWLDSLLAG